MNEKRQRNQQLAPCGEPNICAPSNQKRFNFQIIRKSVFVSNMVKFFGSVIVVPFSYATVSIIWAKCF